MTERNQQSQTPSRSDALSRRELLSAAGGAVVGVMTAHDALAAATILDANPKSEETKMTELKLAARYYRHHPVDYASPSPATGFKGWEETELMLPKEETMFLCMHLWNTGQETGPDWGGADKPWQGWAQMAEWVPRVRELCGKKLPPILEAARKSGMRVGHIAGGSYAEKYPQYQKIKEKYGDAPPAAPGAIKGDWRARHDALVFGETFAADVGGAYKNLDFPVNIRPQGDEPVFLHTHQLNGYLRDNGVWVLFYTGFAINWCLWYSPCGMWDMSRLGYLCNCIPEGVTTVENAQSAPGMKNMDEALWRTSLMFGYIVPAEALAQAIKT
ncbi:MAG TPA: hypothetical protein PL033_21090 [Candidatus Brocadiia bacterium]|nr:hypothetical protein [Candidatus Brocadiia bacterium]